MWERGGNHVLFLGPDKYDSLGLTLYLVEVYIDEFLLGFLLHEGFLGQIFVFFCVDVLVSLPVILLYMVMML